VEWFPPLSIDMPEFTASFLLLNKQAVIKNERAKSLKKHI
jgi:hypothetical protein